MLLNTVVMMVVAVVMVVVLVVVVVQYLFKFSLVINEQAQEIKQ
jgi:hypothetical protein